VAEVNVGTVGVFTKLDVSGLVNGIARAKAELKIYGDHAVALVTKQNKGMADAMSEAGTIMATAGAAIAGGLGVAVKQAAAFDQAMRNVNSIAKLSEGQFGALRQSVMGLTNDPTIKDGPAELAKGLYDVYSSGFQGKAALDVLRVAAQGASAGMTDSATSGRALMAVLNSGIGGVDGTRGAMDLLFKTVDLGVVSFWELAGSIGAVLPTAKAAGISMQEVGAAIAVMTRQGQSGSEAVNDLLNVITKILRPPEAAAKVFQQYGVEVGAAALQSKGLAGVLADITARFGDNKQALALAFPDMQAFRGVLSLTTEGGKAYTDMLGQMATASEGVGATAGALAQQMKGAEFQMGKARQALQAFGVAVGEDVLPMVTPLIDKATALTRRFGEMPDGMRRSAVEATAFAGAGLLAAGALAKMVEVGKTLAPLLGSIAGGLSKISGLLPAIGAAIAASQELRGVDAQLRREMNEMADRHPGSGDVSFGVDFKRVLGDAPAAAKAPRPARVSANLPGPLRSLVGGGGRRGGSGVSLTKVGVGGGLAGLPGGSMLAINLQMQAVYAALQEFYARDAEISAEADENGETLSDRVDQLLSEARVLDAAVGRASRVGGVVGGQMGGLSAAFGSAFRDARVRYTGDTATYGAMSIGPGAAVGQSLGQSIMDQAASIQQAATQATRQMAEAHRRVLRSYGELSADLTAGAWGSIHAGMRRIFGDGRLAQGFAEGLGDMLNSALDEALANIQSYLNKTFGGTLGSILGIGLKLHLGGVFADGGVAPAGQWSLVGERGPELIRPEVATRVLPNGVAPGGGPVSVSVSFSGPVTMGGEADVERLSERLGWHVRQQLRAAW